jgi:hypothetical protein
MFIKETPTGCSERKHRDVRDKTTGVQNGLRYEAVEKELASFMKYDILNSLDGVS